VTRNAVDLTTCDKEPIHLIGAIQPHGAMIVVDKDTMVVEFVSTNTVSFLSAEPEEILGKRLSNLIGEENTKYLSDLPVNPSSPEVLKPWFMSFSGADGKLIQSECLAHRNKDHLILEFLQPEPAPAPVWEDELLRREIVSELVKPGVLEDLTEASAKLIRDVTGFDRVMIYRFAEDKHGEVIAESTNRPDSFLGLHYPASDIPDPARRHFILNMIRSIPDINCENVPIISRKGVAADAKSASPLDLTYSKLRAVAPVHVEYLNNMGVHASLSISLVTNNELWGLIACHHYDKRLISSSRLRFAELLGSTTSALLQSIENTKKLQKSIRAEETAHAVERQARSGAKLKALIHENASKLMDLIDAQGAILQLGGELNTFGPAKDTSLDITRLHDLVVDGVATTSQLSSVIDMSEQQIQTAAGAAFLELSEDGREFLVFLRKQFDQTINWAGKPDKFETKTAEGATRLSPRGSFALWREERRGKSRPFDAMDLDALRIVRRALFALNSLEHEHKAREAQKIAEAEELQLRHALLEAARASSMGELASAIAHELNQPLSALANYISACQQEFKNAGIELPEAARQLIEDAVAETVRAGDLLRRVRNFVSRGDLKSEYIDLNEAIRQGVDLAFASNSPSNFRVNLLLDKQLQKIWADPLQISQVILNLVKNSLTAMENSEKRVLTIEVTHKQQTAMVMVRDTGSGISPEMRKNLFEPFCTSTPMGMGIGLSLCRSIIEAHGGRIWMEPTANGAVIAFQLPIHADPNGNDG
jgi:chemotaxis family two-component system sensor kinase Cph1